MIFAYFVSKNVKLCVIFGILFANYENTMQKPGVFWQNYIRNIEICVIFGIFFAKYENTMHKQGVFWTTSHQKHRNMRVFWHNYLKIWIYDAKTGCFFYKIPWKLSWMVLKQPTEFVCFWMSFTNLWKYDRRQACFCKVGC